MDIETLSTITGDPIRFNLWTTPILTDEELDLINIARTTFPEPGKRFLLDKYNDHYELRQGDQLIFDTRYDFLNVVNHG